MNLTIPIVHLTLAVTDPAPWLETRIPAEALKVAAGGDKGGSARFAYTETADCTTLTLTKSCRACP